MYIEIREWMKEKINKLTVSDYEWKGNMIPANYIENLIADLLCEIDVRDEKIEDLEEFKNEHCDLF